VNRSTPENPKIWLFAKGLGLYERVVPASFRRTVEVLLFGIAPGVPVLLHRSLPRLRLRWLFFSSAGLAFVLSFGVLSAWTQLNGTFSGDDTTILYWIDDLPNLINYSLLVPSYVGLATVLCALMVHGQGRLRRLAALPSRASGRWRRLLVILLILLASSLLTSNYIVEIMNPDLYQKSYWFTEEIAGIRVLGGLGVYYVLLNYSLLVISLLALAAFLSVAWLAFQVGRRLSASPLLETSELLDLRERLTMFTQAYAVAKLLAAVYMLNAYTWRWERPEHSVNLILLGAVLTVMGVFFVSMPRYFIELQWYRLKQAGLTKMPAELRNAYDDIRPFEIQLLANFVDVIVIGGFALSFWMSFV